MRRLLAFVLAAGCTPAAQTPPPATPAAAPAPAAPVAQTPPPAPSGVDESALDRSVDPCDDFFAFACGGWLKSHEIPADKAAYGRFVEIDDRNLEILKQLADDAAASRGEEYPFRDKVGAFYEACSDEARVETTSGKDLAEMLKRVDKIKKVDDLAKDLAALHLGWDNAFFSFDSQQDFADATQMIGVLDQAGLGLPDRDYYLKEDAKSKELQEQYRAHVEKMLTLAGTRPAQAKKDAETIYKIERALAEASMSRVDRRDPKKIYHRIDLAGAKAKAPHFPWAAYLADIGHPDVDKINVATPEFFVALDGILTKTPMAELRTYLRWHAVHGAAQALGRAFVDENFDFYGRKLRGVKELEPRWKRCVRATDHALGEAIGNGFVKRTFGEAGKDDARALVQAIEASMGRNLTGLTWMDDPTRAAAADKLHKIANKIGYPDKWRDYTAMDVARGRSYLGDTVAARSFETHRSLAKIGKPVDRGEWQMSPPTVNAYYDPSLNEMVFPAGILQTPFYAKQRSAALNFGGIGMVMGHELTHGFDDEGRQFDGAGNLRDWWSPTVNKEFERRAECVAKQFDGYEVIDGVHENGKLTLGENIADLGGIKIAHAAMVARDGYQATAKSSEGFTDEQLFFLGVGQAWCTKRRPEDERMRAVVDPHASPKFRVNGPLSNLSEFAAAFQCKPGAKMVRAAEACTVW